MVRKLGTNFAGNVIDFFISVPVKEKLLQGPGPFFRSVPPGPLRVPVGTGMESVKIRLQFQTIMDIMNSYEPQMRYRVVAP